MARSGPAKQQPAAWLIRLQTTSGTPRSAPKRDAGKSSAPQPRAIAFDADTRKRLARAIGRIVRRYPIDLVVAKVGRQDLEAVVRCTADDLGLIADLLKQKLAATLQAAGLKGRCWRKGFSRRALGTDGSIRRVVGSFRAEAKRGRCALLDRTAGAEKLVRRRPR